MKHLRLRRWMASRPSSDDSLTTYDSADIHTARVASFRKAEAVTGLLVGAGSVALAVPGMVTIVSPASALLLLPIATLTGYGALILWIYPRMYDAEPPLSFHQRRIVRRRTAMWGLIILVAVAVPLDWIWPLFLSGWIGIIYAIRQIRQQPYRG